MIPQVDLFSFVFLGEIEDTKDISKLKYLLSNLPDVFALGSSNSEGASRISK